MNDMTPVRGAGQLDLFYGGLAPEIAGKARAAAERIRGRMQLAAESIIEVGRELIEQKAALGHGNFLPWIEAEFGMTDQTARNMMRVADTFMGKSKTILDLAPTALYALAAPSTPSEVRETVESLVSEGETFTAKDIADLKREFEEAKGRSPPPCIGG